MKNKDYFIVLENWGIDFCKKNSSNHTSYSLFHCRLHWFDEKNWGNNFEKEIRQIKLAMHYLADDIIDFTRKILGIFSWKKKNRQIKSAMHYLAADDIDFTRKILGIILRKKKIRQIKLVMHCLADDIINFTRKILGIFSWKKKIVKLNQQCTN